MLSLFLTTALATETVGLELGVLNDEDVNVVQNMLYPKSGRTEFGLSVGWMPFDAYTTTPNAQLSLALHQSDTFSISVVAGGGYGLKTATYRTLEGPAFGVAPYAYRYLASALGGIQWSPIYAKMSLGGAKVIHYDVYIPAHAGVTLEQSVIPQGGFAVSPTVSAGIGGRFFFGGNKALKLELRDDIMLQQRSITQSWHVKQNVNVQLGLVLLSDAKKR